MILTGLARLGADAEVRYTPGGDQVTTITPWISVDERLPELDTPVWLACGDDMFIGCRSDDGDGWLWCNCYGSMYWDKTRWASFDADADDYSPTHWMPLPTPPNAEVSGAGTASAGLPGSASGGTE